MAQKMYSNFDEKFPYNYAKGGAVKAPAAQPVGKKGGSSTRTEVRSPTKTSTSTKANTRGNVTVTGGAGDGDTSVTLNKNPTKAGASTEKAAGGAVPSSMGAMADKKGGKVKGKC